MTLTTEKSVVNPFASMMNAQIALQREALTATREVLHTGFTLARVGVHAARESLSQTPAIPAVPMETVARTFEPFVAAVPGLEAAAAKRAAEDFARNLAAWQGAWSKGANAFRVTTVNAFQQAEELLVDSEKRAGEGFEALERTASQGATAAREWAAAMWPAQPVAPSQP